MGFTQKEWKSVGDNNGIFILRFLNPSTDWATYIKFYFRRRGIWKCIGNREGSEEGSITRNQKCPKALWNEGIKV